METLVQLSVELGGSGGQCLLVNSELQAQPAPNTLRHPRVKIQLNRCLPIKNKKRFEPFELGKRLKPLKVSWGFLPRANARGQ